MKAGLKQAVSIISIVILIFAAAGCATRKPAISAEGFATFAEGAGFEVRDTTEFYDSPLIARSLEAEKGTLSVEFLVSPDKDSVNQVLEVLKNSVDELGGENTWFNSGDRAKYLKTSEDAYYMISKVGLTIVFIETDVANKAEVEEFAKKLGYQALTFASVYNIVQEAKDEFAGMNKVERNVKAALHRVREQAASLTLMSLGKKAATYDGMPDMAEVACSQVVITERSALKGRITVVLVEENIGF